MPTIIVRNLDEKVKRALQLRAAFNGRSMEAEARAILSETVLVQGEVMAQKEGLGKAIRRLLRRS